MDPYLMELCEKHVKKSDIEFKEVIEVGSYNVNGSFRDIIEKHNPLLYLGTDIKDGPGVEKICSITELVSEFGIWSFDAVVCTEVIEHVEDWREAIKNLMQILIPGGIIILTSRSKGFGQHDFPGDFWRYEIEDIRFIFQNFEIEVLEKDEFRGDHFGFFLLARKKTDEIPDLSNYMLYNIKTDPRHNPVDSKLKRTL